MATPAVLIKIDPFSYHTHISGGFVAGTDHSVKLRNERGSWGGSEWRLTMKGTYTGEVWAYGSNFEIDSDDTSIITGSIDLNTSQVWSAVNGSKTVPAIIEFQEVSGDVPVSYGFPVNINVYNTINRDGDLPPDPIDPIEGIEDQQGKAWDASEEKWVATWLVKTDDSRLSDAREPTAHASTHTGGADDIQTASAGQKGLMSAAYASKLDNVPADTNSELATKITLFEAANEAEMIALSNAVEGDEVFRTDENCTRKLKINGTYSNASDWRKLILANADDEIVGPVILREDTEADWQDVILSANELTYATDTGIWKRGDGSTAWQDLPPMTINSSAHVEIREGGDLSAAIDLAASLTPNGSALSATNRGRVVVFPGTYDLSSDKTHDTEYLDIVSATGLSDVILTGANLIITADDTHLCGLDFSQADEFYPHLTSNKPNNILENIKSGGFPVNHGLTFTGEFRGHNVFGGSMCNVGGELGGTNYGFLYIGVGLCAYGGELSITNYGEMYIGSKLNYIGGTCTMTNYGTVVISSMNTVTLSAENYGEFIINTLNGTPDITGKLHNVQLMTGTFPDPVTDSGGYLRNCIDGNGDIVNSGPITS